MNTAKTTEIAWTDAEGVHHSMALDTAVDMIADIIARFPGGVPEAFHPSASHIHPDYRDGWNQCHAAFQAESKRLATEQAEITREEAMKMWQAETTVHGEASSFEWYLAGIRAIERTKR
jgi:hypothetical protein